MTSTTTTTMTMTTSSKSVLDHASTTTAPDDKMDTTEGSFEVCGMDVNDTSEVSDPSEVNDPSEV